MYYIPSIKISKAKNACYVKNKLQIKMIFTSIKKG